MEGARTVANQIDLFMHFLGVSRDGLVARPVEMDKLSSSELTSILHHSCGISCMSLICNLPFSKEYQYIARRPRNIPEKKGLEK
jgi:hypothetical protein